MNRRIPPTPAIAVLLTSLAAGCGESFPSGECQTNELMIGPDAVERLEGAPEGDHSICTGLCASRGFADVDDCRWEPLPSEGDTGTCEPPQGDSSGSGPGGERGSTTGGATSSGTTGDAGTSGTSDAESSGTGGGGMSTGETGGASGDGMTCAADDGGGGTGGGASGGGILYCEYSVGCFGGRGHASLRPAEEVATSSAYGRWLGRMAHAEAASVTAFEAIADELEAFGAPEDLVRRARVAADDERRHAAMMRSLARDHGVDPPPARFEPLPTRDLEALATENAVEGCVRETWAALEACCQALAADDARLRRAMVEIAEDEARHAQLSWDLDAWACSRLGDAAVTRVDEARRRAVEELAQGLAYGPGPELCGRAGLLPASRARRLLAELRRSLWDRAHATEVRDIVSA